MFFDQLTRLLNVHQGLRLALRGFDGIAQASVVALDFDELSIELAEQLDTRHDRRLDVRFCLVEQVDLLQSDQSDRDNHETEQAETQRRTRREIEFTKQHDALP